MLIHNLVVVYISSFVRSFVRSFPPPFFFFWLLSVSSLDCAVHISGFLCVTRWRCWTTEEHLARLSSFPQRIYFGIEAEQRSSLALLCDSIFFFSLLLVVGCFVSFFIFRVECRYLIWQRPAEKLTESTHTQQQTTRFSLDLPPSLTEVYQRYG